MVLEKSGEVYPERMRRLSQSRNHTQLWICVVVKIKFSDMKNSIT